MGEDTDRYVTLVIHTPMRASHLEGFLKSHDIPVRLVPVDMTGFGDKLPLRVRIPESSLPLGLKILESCEDYSTSQIMVKMAGMGGDLLIPVDFSPSSLLAVKIGFYIASKTGVRPVLLHSVLEPIFPVSNMAASEEGVDFPDEDALVEMEEIKEDDRLRRDALLKMSDLKRRIVELQKDGKIPSLKFSTSVLEGVPEEVILQYCKVHNPMMVVMATRSKDKKGADLVGSVTAEVLDSCRVPMFTVPANLEGYSLAEVDNVLMFCTLERHDVVSISALMKTFSYPSCNIYLVPVVERPGRDVRKVLGEMRDSFGEMFPTANFHIHIPDSKYFTTAVDGFIAEHNIGLLLMPNKKTNIFSRIFRPTIAHKCFFQHDLPMMVLPV